MATFAYTARDKAGTIRKGSVFAADQSGAAASLIDRGLVPILIKGEVAGKGKGFSLSKLNFGNKVKLTDKVIFTRQFATMINAGVQITQSLSILQAQASNKHLKQALGAAAKKVEGGATLSSALAEHPDIFSPIYINMVKAGEAGGMLDEVLDRLATQQEKDAEVIGKVKSAMIYPSVITVATLGAFVFLMTVIVPKLASIFEGLGGQLPWYTKLMLTISHALTHYGIYMGIALIGLGIAGTRFVRTPKGKHMLDKILTKIPVFGVIIVKVNVARFARTFGSLMASGISVLEALNTTATALGNTVFQDALRHVAEEVKAGKTISEPLKQMTIFPPIVSQMMAVGEETGQLDQILVKLADFYEKEVDTVVSGLTSIIEPILIMVLGGMVGFIVISVFGPLSALSNAV
jgi:type IV pilus assembly protein PilC